MKIRPMLILCLLFIRPILYADEVRLKNKDRVTGEIIGENGAAVSIKTEAMEGVHFPVWRGDTFRFGFRTASRLGWKTSPVRRGDSFPIGLENVSCAADSGIFGFVRLCLTSTGT